MICPGRWLAGKKEEAAFETKICISFYCCFHQHVYQLIIKIQLRNVDRASAPKCCSVLSRGRNVVFAFFSLILRLGHHHLTKLVEVHRAGAVLVELLQDALQLLLGERSQQLRDQTSQCVRADETLSFLIVQPEKGTHEKIV